MKTNCPRCGAPRGAIGWMCDCWYDHTSSGNTVPEINKEKKYTIIEIATCAKCGKELSVGAIHCPPDIGGCGVKNPKLKFIQFVK